MRSVSPQHHNHDGYTTVQLDEFVDLKEDLENADHAQEKENIEEGLNLKCIEACKLSKHYKCWILTLSLWIWIIIQILYNN